MNKLLNKPILIAGYGSIGQRHLRNLKALGHKKFVIYRTGKSTLSVEEFHELNNIFVEDDLAKALAHKPIATIVSNPTALHMPVALAAAQAGSHLFLEKPISHTVDGVKELRELVKKKKLIAQVGFQFRFHPGLQHIKRLLEENVIGQIVSIQAHWGEHLADWHPWEDYHNSYAAKKELGGGVLLTMCHPFDYLRWLIGEVEYVSALEGRSGGFDIDVEDSADVLLPFKTGTIGNVHLDYLQRPSEHFLRLIGTKGVIYWNNATGLVQYCQGKGKWKTFSVPDGFERNTMFLDEMKHFLTCITKNQQPLCNLKDGIETLRIILAAKESTKVKRMVKV